MRYRNMTDLQRDVKAAATEKQRETITQWESTGWHVFAAKYRGSVGVIFISHPDSLGPAVIYPDGTPQRAIKGKKSVSFSWSRAEQ